MDCQWFDASRTEVQDVGNADESRFKNPHKAHHVGADRLNQVFEHLGIASEPFLRCSLPLCKPKRCIASAAGAPLKKRGCRGVLPVGGVAQIVSSSSSAQILFAGQMGGYARKFTFPTARLRLELTIPSIETCMVQPRAPDTQPTTVAGVTQ